MDEADELQLALKSALPAIKAAQKAVRPHDIYDRTLSMPNKELRLMDIPVKSNLFFQMLLFYHKTYDPLYFTLELGASLHRLVFSAYYSPLHFVTISCLLVWLALEIPRLSYGIGGNINELFPEMFAFFIFSTIFTLPLSVIMIVSSGGANKYPHEFVTVLINIIFVVLEIITSLVVLCE